MKNGLPFVCLVLVFFSAVVFAADIPDNVTLSAGETTLLVDWNGDSESDNYFVYWGTSSGNLDNRATVDDSVTKYTISGLTPSTTYYVAVSSNENSEESDLSVVISATTSAEASIPATPTGFFITGLNAVTETSAAFKWDQSPAEDLDYYNLYYGTSAGSYTTVLEAADGDESYFNVTGLETATRYYFSLTAVDISGNESEAADEVVVDTKEDRLAPFPPAGVSGGLEGDRSIQVNVGNSNQGMADFSGTILYYGTTAGALDEQVDLGGSFTYTLDDLPVGSVWYFSASAYDTSGNESTRTLEISVTVEDTRRFLNQPEAVDGGCFITAAAGAGHLGRILVFCGFMAGVLFFFRLQRRGFKRAAVLFLCCLSVVGTAAFSRAENPPPPEIPEMPGNNIAGVSVGYFMAQESEFEDFYGEDTFPVYGFYERFLSKHFSLNLEAGFLKEKGCLLSESGTQTRIRTKLTLVPVAASLKFSLKLMPYVVGYVGAGPDYWYCQEEVDTSGPDSEIEEWIGGYHGNIGVRLYSTDKDTRGTGALVEAAYSQIDRFGDNETNIGGWSFKFGLFYHF